MSGWARLKKGRLAGMLCSSSRLYLTLDFESRVLCVDRWAPVPFQDIVHVEPLGEPSECERDDALGELSLSLKKSEPLGKERTSRTSTTSVPQPSGLLRKSNSSGALSSLFQFKGGCGVQERCGFVFQTTGTKMTFLTTSQQEADGWVVGLREAMAVAKVQQQRDTDSDRWATPPSNEKTPLSTPPLMGGVRSRHRGRIGSSSQPKEKIDLLSDPGAEKAGHGSTVPDLVMKL